MMDGTSTKAAGAPSGGSRLSAFAFVIGTIVVTVLFVTVSSMDTLQGHFGSWGSSGNNAVTVTTRKPTSTKLLRPTNTEGKTIKISSVPSDPSDWTAVDSEDEIEPEEVKPTKKKKAKKSTPKPKKGKEIVTSNTDAKENEATVSSSTPSMLKAIIDAREEMVKTLRKKYGNKNFEKMFQYKEADDKKNKIHDKAIPMPEKLKVKYRPIRPLGPKDLYRTEHWAEDSDEWNAYWQNVDEKYFNSVENLQRKMMIKVLLARQQRNKKDAPSTKYIWATGGHSAAAGHGNLFYESYTKVMEATASDVFSSVGLQLDARNYAMGATSSASEMSMCFKEVYGDDVDIFSWDFGMLEARNYLAGRLMHYATRGILSSRNRILPAFVGLHAVDGSRVDSMVQLHNAFRGTDKNNIAENNGLSLFLNDESYWKIILKQIPDTAEAGSQAEIDKMPEFVRYLNCDGGIEKGDPYCGDNKYNETICPDRDGKASWHPGWKWHALLGNSMALFLTEMLVGAVQQIEDSINGDDADDEILEELLNQLLRKEDEFREQVVNAQESELPEWYNRVFWYNNTDDNWDTYPKFEEWVSNEAPKDFKDAFNALPRSTLFNGPSICHTARLPAQTRFFGTLTNQPEMTGNQTIYGRETYFVGINEETFFKQNADSNEDTSRDMTLVTIQKERQEGCGEELAKPDYHDFFMMASSDKWSELSFPNEMEKAAYNYHENEKDYKGILIMIPRFCAFGDCEKGFLGHNEFNEGKWEMRVNGKPVKKMTLLGHESVLLEHADGMKFDRNDQGRYDLTFKVNEPDSFIKISAFVMY